MTECPVCAEPAEDDVAVCTCCGWTLRAGPWLGWADDAARAAFQQRLDAAAAMHDLVAAVRSGAQPHAAAALGLRGGPPEEVVWAAAAAVVAEAKPASATNGALLGVLTRLTGRTTPVLHVVALSTEHLAHQRVVVDDVGFPVTDGPTRTSSWVSAGLAAEPVRQRFQLAGGVGASAPDLREFDRAVGQALSRTREGECVLVAPPAGWRLLDRAQAIVRRSASVQATIEVAPESVDLRKIVVDLLDDAPLPCDYDLVLQQVDEDGVVGLVAQRLFAAGSRSGPQGIRHRVAVHGSPVGNPAAGIPVIARSGPNPASWPVVALGRTDLPARSTAQVDIALTGLRDLTVSRTDGVSVFMAAEARFGELIATIPDRVALAPTLDLACAVELWGAEADVRRRLAFASRLIELVAAQHHRPDDVRVAVVGYGDHWDRPTAAYPLNRVVVGGRFLGPTRAALDVLEDLKPHPAFREGGTAVEDALDMLSRLRWRRSQRVLVVVGHRPPCFANGAGPVPTCPKGLDWGEALQRLRTAQVRMIGVRELRPITSIGGVDGDAIRFHADRFWRALAGSDPIAFAPEAVETVAATVVHEADISVDAFPLGLAAPIGAVPRSRSTGPTRSVERTRP
jgi:hypothetical protein